MREVAGAADHLELPVAEAGERAAVARRCDLVAVAMDDQHRAVQVPRQLAQGASVAVDRAIRRGYQRLGVGVERPFHAVLDGLARVRLRKASRDKPLRELGVVPSPMGPVHVSPPAIHRQRALKEVGERHRIEQHRPLRRGVGEQRADEGGPGHPLRGEPRQLEQVLGAAREAHHHCPLGAGRVHHGQAVASEIRGSIALRVAAAVGAPVAEAVHAQHPEVAREVGDLHLPVAGVDQRPGRDQKRVSSPSP